MWSNMFNKNKPDEVQEKLFSELDEETNDKIPLTVWILAFVSLFMNAASVVITALTPAFVTIILHGSASTIGNLRGITEALAYLIKLFSGVISDYIGKRKILILIGYSVAAFTKPLFAIASNIYVYATAQTLERIANGLRDTPRDALIADCVPKKIKGTCFGIRQGFAYFGSFIGSVACYFLIAHFGAGQDESCQEECIRLVYFCATVPVIFSVVLIYFGIQDSKEISTYKRRGFPIKKTDLIRLGRRYWFFLAVVFIFMLARFSESFLVLRIKENGANLEEQVLALGVMYLFNSPTSNIVGKLSDKYSRKIFLIMGCILMIISYAILAYAESKSLTLIGIAVYGIHYGMTQSTFFTFVADYAPVKLKGTAFGVFNLICAMGMFSANLIAGHIWDAKGAQSALLFSCGIAFLALIFLFFIKQKDNWNKDVRDFFH